MRSTTFENRDIFENIVIFCYIHRLFRFCLVKFRLHLDWAENSSVCVRVWCFFFFCTHLWDLRLLFMHCQSVHIVHYSRTHKFHFSTTFSLKIGPTILFTHLKIILLQCFSFSVFSFQLYPNGPLVIYIYIYIYISEREKLP